MPFAKQPFEVFFGPEHEKSAGLIHHVDCGQLIHAESIVEEAVEKNVVGLPECPRCKTQIRKTVRFNSQINLHLEKVEMVKATLWGDEDAKHKDQVIKAIIDSFNDEARSSFS